MLKLLLGDPNARKLKRYQPIVSDISLLEEEVATLSDDELRGLTGDGVHMTPEGNMLLARTVLAAFGLDDAQLARAREVWLDLPDADDSRSGVLVAMYRQVGNHIKAGVGYNFSDFSDDLTQLDYRHQGLFVNLVAKY